MQKEKSNLKVLCDLIDPEDSGDEGSETQYEMSMLYSKMYDLLEIHSYFGTTDFKSVYMSTINDIKEQDFKNQRTLCLRLLEKIFELYEYEFPQTPDLYSQEDLNKIYELVEFLDFNNEMFLVGVWNGLGKKNILNINLEVFFYGNRVNILRLLEQITNNSLLYDKDSLINIFLNSCRKEILTKIFIDMTEKMKAEITLKLMEL